MTEVPLTIRGRGAAGNPGNRFETIHVEPDLEHVQGDDEYMERLAKPQTVYLRDDSKSVIATNDSPDVGFTHSINPYRGCTHGCAYCYARPGHEYLGMSAGLDFETKIMVKLDAPELLRRELARPSYEPVTISISGVTDCYQPAERKFRITRQCLEVLAECGNPASIISKNHLVTRDIDVLAKMAERNLIVVMISITTLDPHVTAKMEPRTASPKLRLDVLRKLTAAGVPCGVMVAPVIPGLTDHEIPMILKAAAEAGARTAGYVPVRLPYAVAPIFEDWCYRHYPDRAEKILNRIRDLRGGKLNDPNFDTRMHGQGVWAEQLETMFKLAKRRAGLDAPFPTLSTEHFRRPEADVQQMLLW